MAETLRLGDVVIAVTRKDVKHVHLSVHPPSGRVTLVAPTDTRLGVVGANAASKIPWIRSSKTECWRSPATRRASSSNEKATTFGGAAT